MEIETTQTIVEPVTISEVLQVATMDHEPSETWNRPRSDEEIQSFIQRREQAVGYTALSDFGLAA